MSNATHNAPWKQDENTLYRDLLRECAEVLRTAISECVHCDWGHGATGQDAQYHPCKRCTPLRELLRRVEAVT